MWWLEFCLLALAFAGMACGMWAIYWARTSSNPDHALRGQRLFVLTLLSVSLGSMVAVSWHADALTPLGLSAGFLVMAMLWETPRSATTGETR